MCGIAGIIGIDLPKDRSESACDAMLRALRHRGPDACGLYHDHPGRSHLAHARLSIIDLSDRANQPFHRHNRYSIVFNGEIYNYQALRKNLETSGAEFLTTSDTEVILALYEKEGPEAFQKLRGMYAFTIWDRQERRGVLARDPFGIKPLYVAGKEKGLLFASEIKALVSSGLLSPRLSPEGLSAYLRWGSVDQNIGLLEGIESVPPGYYLEIREDRITSTCFQSVSWDSTAHDANIPDFRQAFLDSVSAHLVSDVPVGLFLSGGLDSSSILAACHILGQSNVRSFTLSFPEKEEDESPATRKVADHFGVRLTSESPQTHELPSLFSGFLEHQDLPSIDGFNTYYVSRLATAHGIKVVLSGLGGDELLGGYPSFHRVAQWSRAGRLFSQIPGRKLLAGAIGCLPGNKTARLSGFLAGSSTPFDAYTANRCLFSNKEIHAILNTLGIRDVETGNSSFSGMDLGFSLTDISRMEATCYMKNQLLRDSDACSMRHGIELRVPFVDVPLWNLSARLPSPIRYEKGKALLHKALPELPEWLFYLPKKGFTLPYNHWRKGPLFDFFKDFPPNTLSYSPTWYQEMALLSLGHWQKKLGILP